MNAVLPTISFSPDADYDTIWSVLHGWVVTLHLDPAVAAPEGLPRATTEITGEISYTGLTNGNVIRLLGTDGNFTNVTFKLDSLNITKVVVR